VIKQAFSNIRSKTNAITVYEQLGEWSLDEPIPVRRTVAWNPSDWTSEEGEGEGVFVRYGELPACGRSHDFTYQEHHPGVAVWKAVLTPWGRYLLCADRLAHQAQLVIQAVFQQRLFYQASGEEVAIVQGEVPILRNCNLERRPRTRVEPVPWSRELMYEVLRQYPPLQSRLKRSGQARTEPNYERGQWHRVWAEGGRVLPEHESNSSCPLAPPAPHQLWQRRALEGVR
jgi:hypothetical protein